MQIGDLPQPYSPFARLLNIMIMVRPVDFILDIDECAGDTHNCSRNNATCTNTEGSFNCSCKQGFIGLCLHTGDCGENRSYYIQLLARQRFLPAV